MNLTHAQLTALAESSGHQPEPLERVLRLIDLLNALRGHPFLGPRLALKGGTALNLFIFDLPRLSVDIDLNYIGAADRETMLAERPLLEAALLAVFKRQGLAVKRAPNDDHAGYKCRLGYSRSAGDTGNLELDLNFMYRVPLWPPMLSSSRPVAGRNATSLVLDVHELAAGKLAAAFGRRKSRDLFDFDGLFRHVLFDMERLRLAFVAYGGMSTAVDWRTLTPEHLDTTEGDVMDQLLPMLRRDASPARDALSVWTRQLVERCRERARELFPLQPNELEFLAMLNEHGELQPELLTEDPAMQARIAAHPALLWKRHKAREHTASRF